MWIRFLLYGAFGWCTEIVWTAVVGTVEKLAAGEPADMRLAGRTYLWMFPIYAGGGLAFEVVYGLIGQWPWIARGLTYMLGCFAIEYASGWLIRRLTGSVPWDYTQARWGVHALIRLDYAPAWFAFGLLLEVVSRIAHACEPAIRSAM